MSITQQPAKTAIVNSFLSPSPAVKLSNTKHNSFVSVSLVYDSFEEEVAENVLQGTKRIAVDSDGMAVFSKLKIVEFSLKKRYGYALLFKLEAPNNEILAVKSDCFYIQSRPAMRVSKRRRDLDNISQYYGSGGSSDEDYVQHSPREKTHAEFETKSQGILYAEHNYVDITDFLTLPQKEAASRLGISESMLCKRFKECTRRKWPYRYIRKIDKIINMLCVHHDGPLSPEDKKKLDKLVKEREERLQPVKIRITAHDRTVQPPTTRSESPSPPPSSPGDSSEASNFNDEEQFVLETLEMLKTQKSPKDLSPTT